MSTTIAEIAADDKSDSVDVVRVAASDGAQVQLTQGAGLGMHDPGFIKLTWVQAVQIRNALNEFITDQVSSWD